MRSPKPCGARVKPTTAPRAPAEGPTAAAVLREAAVPTPREPVRAEPVRPAGPPVHIPDGDEQVSPARVVLADARGPVAEHYRHFAIRTNRILKQRDARTLLVTSASRGEGKTTTSANLALALASIAGGRRIALVDLDLRRPAVAESLGVQPQVGFEEVLRGDAALHEARNATQLSDLDLYLLGDNVRDPLELLSSPTLGATLRELGRQYDVAVIDTPPVLPVPDVPLIQPHVDAALVVARAGESRCGPFEDMLEAIDREKVLGVFLNQIAGVRKGRYYGYYTYDRDGD